MHLIITDLPVPDPPITTSERPFGTRQLMPFSTCLLPEGFAHVVEDDVAASRPCAQSENRSEVSAKLAARIRIAELTTALVVARPTPCAPPFELKP